MYKRKRRSYHERNRWPDVLRNHLRFPAVQIADLHTEDVAAARELAAIAGVDADSYGLEMLKAGADLSDKTIAQFISIDAKEFQMGSYKVEIAQVNAVDVNDVLDRQADLEAALNTIIAAKGLDLFLFVVTDILNNDSIAWRWANGRCSGEGV